VNVPPILQRHPALRWLAPIGIACVAGLAATGVFTSSASSTESLPTTTPAALIAAVQGSDVSGFSGTVVSHLSLGLPELPAIGSVGEGTSFTSLLSGSHTMQVWYGGLDKQRVALLGSTEETDVFRDGTELWQWSSADHLAVHAVLPKTPREPAGSTPLPSSLATLTPLQLARETLGALDPTTRVEVAADRTVADRSTYDLVLTPRTPATKVGSVRISVDGQTKVPLGVQVFAQGSSSPAIDVAFTSIVFAPQPDRNFQFSPPDGATVRRAAPPVARSGAATSARSQSEVRVLGKGWTSVVDVPAGDKTLAALRPSAVLKSLTPVSGVWGKGYLLDSDLVSALVTVDGRILAGAVQPEDLYTAAGRK
jgi:outer membrane lipoprotein-sorting protein